MTEEQVSLYPGDTFTLHAISISSYIIAPVTWKSSNESIISVDKNGKVIALESGMAEIIATVDNGESIICNVEVKIPDLID